MTATWCDVGPAGRITGPVKISYNDPWPVKNGYSSGFVSPARGVVLHTEDGYEQGTIAWFNNPAAQASATFAVGLDGSCWQFGPAGHGWGSWAQVDGNLTFYSIEDADNTHPSVPFSIAQQATLALLIEALSFHDGFPLAVASDPFTQRGVALHSEGGSAWGGHFECPGSVRGAQRPSIIAKAQAIRKQREAASVTVTSWKSDGSISLAQLADRRKVGVSTVLRVTAAHGLFDAPLAQYINDVFSGRIPASAPIPAGALLWVPVNG